MVQGRPARVPAQAGAWGEARAEAGWMGHLQQGRVEVASVRTVEKEWLMLRGSPVMQEAAQIAEQK
jgi:hypothetical protein